MEKKDELFITLRGEAHAEFEEKRSLFIGHAIRTDTEEEALAFIKALNFLMVDPEGFEPATH